MKCKVCGSAMDNAGDKLFYCPKCAKVYDVSEEDIVREEREKSVLSGDFLGSSGMSELDSMRTELKRSDDLFSGSRIYDAAENGYSSTTENQNAEPERVTYEDKREVIDETKPQSSYTEQKTTSNLSQKPASAGNITPANNKNPIIRLIAAIIFTWVGCSTVLLALPLFFVVLIMAVKCKKEAKTAENPKGFITVFGILIFLDCILALFSIIDVIIIAGLIYAVFDSIAEAIG